MEQNKQVIDRILTSLEGMQRAEAPPFLLNRIETELDEGASIRWPETVGSVRLGLAGIAFALLLLFNIGLLDHASQPRSRSSHRATTSTDYQLNTKAFDLY